MIEAMAAGVPILAWDSAPIRDFLEHERPALLVSPDNIDAARDLALQALSDPKAYVSLGRSAALLARERYDRDATLPRLAGLLSERANINK
jgi:glycosyltransferase involved in cell wall biosynthesis